MAIGGEGKIQKAEHILHQDCVRVYVVILMECVVRHEETKKVIGKRPFSR
jgi:hypothetical protein